MSLETLVVFTILFWVVKYIICYYYQSYKLQQERRKLYKDYLKSNENLNMSAVSNVRFTFGNLENYEEFMNNQVNAQKLRDKYYEDYNKALENRVKYLTKLRELNK